MFGISSNYRLKKERSSGGAVLPSQTKTFVTRAGGVLDMKGAFISCLWGSTKRQGLGLDGNRFLSPSTAIAN